MRGLFARAALVHSRRGLAVVSAAGVAATGLTVWWAASSPTFVDPTGLALWRGIIIATYWSAGVVTWWRRPESRLGGVILCLTLLYVGQAAVGSSIALVYTFGMVVWAASITYTAYVFLCVPTGQVESRLDRSFVRGYWLTTAVVWALILALAPTLPPGGSFVNCGTRCPPNALQVVDGHADVATALTTAFHVQFTIALIGLAVLIVGKARSSSSIRRRAMLPLAVAMIADIGEFVIALFVLPSYPAAGGVLKVADGLVTLAVPVAIVIGQVTADRLAATRSSQIALGTGGTPMNLAGIETMLRDAIGDPTLHVAVWDRSGYVDARGLSADLPRADSMRRVTEVTRDGQPVAAVVHDAALDAEPQFIAGLTATALMLLQNTRLVHELRASRARLVSAAERERSRLEGDLHDGAMQRLAVIQGYLGVARELTDRADARAQIDHAAAQADAALSELRTLSYGIHPTALRDFGLAAAIRDLALASPVDVRLTDAGIGRYSEEVEAELYLFVREAIQEAVRHRGRGAKVTLTLSERDDAVEVHIRGDLAGTQLDRDHPGRGMTAVCDRIESLGGVFRIDSVLGGGTSLHAAIPARTSSRHSRAPSTDEDAEAPAAS